MPLRAPTVIDLYEQASGGYWATILDEAETLVPGNVLAALTLTLYVVKADGTMVIVNGRNKQSVLNLNDVQVFNALQTRGDGKTYNLFWQIRQEDTTLVDSTLALERHMALFEWTWPNVHYGKQEVVLAIKNLAQVL